MFYSSTLKLKEPKKQRETIFTPLNIHNKLLTHNKSMLRSQEEKREIMRNNT